MRLIILLFLSFIPFLGNTQSIHVDVTGMIFNTETDSIFISQFYGDRYLDHHGTAFDKDGNFELKCDLPNPDYYVLRFGSSHVNLILRDKANIQVYGDVRFLVGYRRIFRTNLN